MLTLRVQKWWSLELNKYPYRYFKYVSSEIINQFSHKALEITVYFKEGTDVYIREGDTFFINITNVKVTSYSDGVNPPDYVRIIPTSTVQPSDSKRAAFNILSHTNSSVNQAIAKGSFTSTERINFQQHLQHLCLSGADSQFRKSKCMERDWRHTQTTVNFVFPIYLQHLFVSLWTIAYLTQLEISHMVLRTHWAN